jgi:hypothetical protein
MGAARTPGLLIDFSLPGRSPRRPGAAQWRVIDQGTSRTRAERDTNDDRSNGTGAAQWPLTPCAGPAQETAAKISAGAPRTPRVGRAVGPRSHTGTPARQHGGEPPGTPSSKRHHDERFTAERRPVGHRRVGSGHPLGHRAGTMQPPILWHTADSLLGAAAQPTRDARVAYLLRVRERQGTRTGQWRRPASRSPRRSPTRWRVGRDDAALRRGVPSGPQALLSLRRRDRRPASPLPTATGMAGHVRHRRRPPLPG